MAHGVSAAAARAGRAAAGPVLSLLRTFSVVGLVFGAYAEASPAVYTLLSHTADRASEGWRAMGHRTRAEARAMLYACLQRDWAFAAARAAARLRLSRRQYIGMPRAQIERLMRQARRDRQAGADPAQLPDAFGVQRMDALAGAYLREPRAVGG